MVAFDIDGTLADVDDILNLSDNHIYNLVQTTYPRIRLSTPSQYRLLTLLNFVEWPIESLKIRYGCVESMFRSVVFGNSCTLNLPAMLGIGIVKDPLLDILKRLVKSCTQNGKNVATNTRFIPLQLNYFTISTIMDTKWSLLLMVLLILLIIQKYKEL